jgi:hypothetical protein
VLQEKLLKKDIDIWKISWRDFLMNGMEPHRERKKCQENRPLDTLTRP